MSMKTLRKFIGFARNPWLMILAGVFLASSSLYELGNDLMEMSEGIKTAHGTFVYGFIVVIRSLGELDEGMGMVAEGDEGMGGGSEA